MINRISNEKLYKRCNVRNLGELIKSARWRLFGHVLRLPLNAPAQLAMMPYVDGRNMRRCRGRPRYNVPDVLQGDMKGIAMPFNSLHDLQNLRQIAVDRNR